MRHASIFFLGFCSHESEARPQRIGLHEEEITGSKAHIFILEFWASVTGMTHRDLECSHSLFGSSVRLNLFSFTHNMSSMQLESRVSKSQSHAFQRLILIVAIGL